VIEQFWWAPGIYPGQTKAFWLCLCIFWEVHQSTRETLQIVGWTISVLRTNIHHPRDTSAQPGSKQYHARHRFWEIYYMGAIQEEPERCHRNVFGTMDVMNIRRYFND